LDYGRIWGLGVVMKMMNVEKRMTRRRRKRKGKDQGER
jgi:hypothetical protein